MTNANHAIVSRGDLRRRRSRHFHKTVALPRAGLTLGMLALGNLLISMTPASAATPLRIVFGVVSLLYFITVATKFFVQPAEIITNDMQNPVVAPVSATVFMTMMQFATYLMPAGGIWATLAVFLWYFAVSFNVALMAHITTRFVAHDFQLSNVFPTWFVGYVGIVVASATSAPVGQQALGQIIFWIGFVLYMLMLALVTMRMARHPLPEPAKPTFAIYTAPMSLSIAGYTTAFADPNVWFVLVMLIAAQLLYVLVLVNMPHLLRLKFYPSYAAFTFPFVITATALLKALTLFEAHGWQVPAWLHVLQVVETVLACAIVLYVAILFAYHIFRHWVQAGQTVREEIARSGATATLGEELREVAEAVADSEEQEREQDAQALSGR